MTGAAKPRGRRRPGALENEVLAVLWAANRPLLPAEVQEQLGSELAYTTVLTALTRLHQKGVVEREPVGRAHAYTPVTQDAVDLAEQMGAMLQAAGDRAAIFQHFVAKLSAEDEAVLRALLKSTEG